MAHLINGRALAADIRRELKANITAAGFKPTLGVILVGNDPASHLYVSLKERAAHEVGVTVEKAIFPADTKQQDLLEKINNFNERTDIDAVLVQLPLPQGIDENTVINTIRPDKDADGFHRQNLSLLNSDKSFIIPGLSLGIVRLIESTGLPLNGKNAVLIVNSDEFARPTAELLRQRGLTVDISQQPDSKTSQADVIVVAVGKPNTIHSEHVKNGAVVIDVGTTKTGDRVVGDVAQDEFMGREIYLTPVPGGVGPMTVAMLLRNVYQLALRFRDPSR